MKSPKPIFTLGIIVLIAFFVIGIYISSLVQQTYIADNTVGVENILPARTNDSQITSARKLDRSQVEPTDPVRGSDEAVVDIIEYGDFECIFCAQVQPALEKVLIEYKDVVRLVWKDFPNPIHPNARSAALAARCAQEQDKFWEYHDFLFANQDQLSRSMYSQIAYTINLNTKQFDACLDSQKTIGLIGEGIDEAQKLEVSGTPYFIINGHRLDFAGEYQDFALLIERAIVDIQSDR